MKSNSLWRDALKRLRKNKAAMLGFFFFGFVVLSAVIGPLLVPYSYEEQDYDRVANPPLVMSLEAYEQANFIRLSPEDYLQVGPVFVNLKHPLGTDTLGRDILARLLLGARISLAVGFLAGLVSILIGVIYGATAGYVGGRLDQWMMRVVDTLYSLPFMFFVILLMAFVGRSFILLFVAIGAVSWLTTARIVRGQVISLKNSEFVEAAHVSGTPSWMILMRHLIPNTLGPIIVYFSLIVPRLMLEESFLSFLGLGVQAPMASWGSMIADGQSAILNFPYMVIIPGLALTLTLFSLNFIGDGLRDALDPRLKGKQ
jgi:oligopeptide transport system permease protein